uniref:Uncharacterized protein n=1 Tax=Romanomermis culicivorax TaxID=13658 RepID=A0A915IRT9_ROMCU
MGPCPRRVKLSIHTQKGPANGHADALSGLPNPDAKATYDRDDAYLHRPEGNVMMIQQVPQQFDLDALRKEDPDL